MSHKNFFLDYTVGVFVVHQKKCLLCYHRNMNMWLPVGGHIEDNETPDKAALRETIEEAGIEVKLIGNKIEVNDPRVEALITPMFVDRHFVRGEHWHLGLFYPAVPVDQDPKIKLDVSEHIALDWFTRDQVDQLTQILPSVSHYAKYAIDLIK